LYELLLNITLFFLKYLAVPYPSLSIVLRVFFNLFTLCITLMATEFHLSLNKTIIVHLIKGDRSALTSIIPFPAFYQIISLFILHSTIDISQQLTNILFIS